MQVDPNILREYDVRGIAGTKFSQKALEEYEKWYGKFPGINITPPIAEAIGKAYGTTIRNRNGKKVIVGHEIRPFGEDMKMAFIKGVRSTGCDVLDAGVALTPLIYFATAFYRLDGGVNVTGSHNVYFFNGFKMMAKDVYPIAGKELQGFHQIIAKEQFIQEEPGSYEKKDVATDYQNYLIQHLKLARPLKIVVDCGNGTPGIFAPEIFEKLGCRVIGLYTEPDATFPNHTPDPEDPYLMKDLSTRVVAEKADLGIGLDADGDRVGAVDENGEYILADRLILLLAKDILTRHPNKKILYDIKCTRLLNDLVPQFGGQPLMHRTGHAPIKQTLREDTDIIFGGEVSGHFYFVETFFGFDDGISAAASLLSLASQTTKPFSSLFTQFPQTVMTPEIKLPCQDQIKHQVVKDITDYFSPKYKTITIDGVRIIFSSTSCVVVRASKTSPCLTVRAEADTKAEVLKIKNILADQLEKYPEIEDKLDRQQVTSRTGKLGWV